MALREALARWLTRAGTDHGTHEPSPDGEADETADGDESSVLNPRMLADIRSLDPAGGDDTLAELVGLFLGHAPSQVAAIEGAAEAGDAATLARAAHSLKGEALNVGAERLGRLALHIEKAARAGSVDEWDVVAQLKSALATTEAAFHAELGKRKGEAA